MKNINDIFMIYTRTKYYGLYSIQNGAVVIFVLLIILQLRDSIARFIFDFTANHILYVVELQYIKH